MWLLIELVLDDDFLENRPISSVFIEMQQLQFYFAVQWRGGGEGPM